MKRALLTLATEREITLKEVFLFLSISISITDVVLLLVWILSNLWIN